jgi:hypothetical protein
VVCVFRCAKEPLGFLASQKPSRLRVPKIPRMKSVIDSKWQNKSAKGSHVPTRIGPDFDGPFTRAPFAPSPSPGAARPGQARQVSARTCSSFFLSPTLARAWRASNYLSLIFSTSTSKVGLTYCHTPLH